MPELGYNSHGGDYPRRMNEFPQSIEQKGAILQENGTVPPP